MNKKPSSVAVCLTMQYGKMRGQMSEQTLRERIKLAQKLVKDSEAKGYFVVGLVDDYAKTFFKSSTNCHIFAQPTKNYTEAKGAVIKKALDVLQDDLAAIIQTEPEKLTLVPYFSQLAQPILKNKADFVIAGRKSLKSYPHWQQYWEACGNAMCYEAMGKNFDFFFGPRVMNKKVAQKFLKFPGRAPIHEDYQSYNAFPYYVMLKKYRTTQVTVPFTYPKNQTKAEEKDLTIILRRCRVLQSIMTGIVHYKHWVDSQKAI